MALRRDTMDGSNGLHFASVQGRLSMPVFEATHEITLIASDGSCRTIEVQLVDGAAQTEPERRRSAAAHWTCVDGRWSFLGAPLPAGVISATFVSVARSGFDRLAWELSDPTRGIVRDGDRLVLRRRDGAPALWLEVADDRLRLVDRDASVVLDPDTTDRRIRELAMEWQSVQATEQTRTRRAAG